MKPFEFTVTVEVDRVEGKFASRGELQQALIEALEAADPSSLDGENGGLYETTTWEVTVV